MGSLKITFFLFPEVAQQIKLKFLVSMGLKTQDKSYPSPKNDFKRPSGNLRSYWSQPYLKIKKSLAHLK